MAPPIRRCAAPSPRRRGGGAGGGAPLGGIGGGGRPSPAAARHFLPAGGEKGEGERKRRALAWRALRPHPPAVGEDELLDDREAEARAAGVPGAGGIDA